MLNRLGHDLIGGPELLPTRYPPKDDEPSREAYVNAPKQPGFDDAAGVRRRPRREEAGSAEGAEGGPPRPRAPGPLLRPRVPARLRHGPTASTRRLVLDTDAKGLRRWPADAEPLPRARCAGRCVECEAQFTAGDVEPPAVVRRVLRDVSRRLVERDLGGQAPTASPRSRRSTRSTAVPPTPLPQLWELHSCFEKPEAAITRTDSKLLKDRFKELRESRGEAEGLRPRDADAHGLLRLAAARAAGARERADVHGRRRPRRDRRLEPRPRVARPRLHLAARPAHHHQRARRLRRASRTGATTRCATARSPTGGARPRGGATSR